MIDKIQEYSSGIVWCLFVVTNSSKINLIQLNNMFNFPFKEVNGNIRVKTELKPNMFGYRM